jgi:hypothetical protein
MIHLPTGKSFTPYLHSRDCARVHNWARQVERERRWRSPEEPSSKRNFRFLKPTRSSQLRDLVRKKIVPTLLDVLQRAGGKTVSIENRCRLGEQQGQVLAMRPVVCGKRREECVVLSYGSITHGTVKDCILGGPLFYHGPAWWEDGRVQARRKNPPRPRPGSAKQIEKQRLYLRRLAAEGRAIHQQNLPEEFRPLLQRMELVAARLRQAPTQPQITPRAQPTNPTPAPAQLAGSPDLIGLKASLVKAADELESLDYDGPAVDR